MAEQAGRRAPEVRRQFAALGVALAFLVVGAVLLYYVQSSSRRDRAWIEDARQLVADIGQISKVAGDAARGIAPDFRALSGKAVNFDDSVKMLRKGDAAAGLLPMPASVGPQLARLEAAWAQMKKPLDELLSRQDAYGRTVTNVAVIAAAAPKAAAVYDQLAQRLVERGAPSTHTALVAAQLVHLERLQTEARRLLGDGGDARRPATRIDAEVRAFTANSQTLLAQGVDSALVRNAMSEFAPVEVASRAIVADAPVVEALQGSSALLQSEGGKVLAAATALEQALDEGLRTSRILPYIAFGAIGLALIALLAVGWIAVVSLRARQTAAEAGEARQQQAILQLLDEISTLANGDLTVDVTVTEDFTGAIADSINYTVQTLRGLAGTINRTSEQIVASAAGTSEIARRMSEASERQARDVSAVTNIVTASSQKLQDVAARAEKLAVQAQNSVQTAHNGAATVDRTIRNMASLRETIQDTAKRIKRLGESSQEIGNITELINDITERTNTLALNASIQAAMAGEAGRGFAVVADQVQRLAESAASATRQIETLVKTIQADTNEAIVSMERSTANVVSGAKSAEEAGQSLTRIEASSQELAGLIQEISGAARNQSAEAARIAGAMQSIREIAVQTSGSAGQTSKAIGELNTLSDKLRESVAGFKLPDNDGVAALRARSS